ncbi:MAG TPA: hypothetical protein VIY52_15845 [Streptosporangiaceae bacterium]
MSWCDRAYPIIALGTAQNSRRDRLDHPGHRAAVGIEPSAARAEGTQVTFDRPYLMLVTDSATGEPLFLARVANPAAGTSPAA